MNKLPPIEEALAQLNKTNEPVVVDKPTMYDAPQMQMQAPAPQESIPEPIAPQRSLPPIEQALMQLQGEPQSFPQLDTPVADIPPVPITQTFGQRSQYDVFSGGVNTGVDYATPVGTPVILPQGQWQVEDAYAQAEPTGGYIGNGANQGYGNSVVVVNTQTGEKLRLSHLSEVNVKPGEVIRGGQIGLTGESGNTHGAHLDLEYRNPRGELSDVLKSPYANIIPHL